MFAAFENKSNKLLFNTKEVSYQKGQNHGVKVKCAWILLKFGLWETFYCLCLHYPCEWDNLFSFFLPFCGEKLNSGLQAKIFLGRDFLYFVGTIWIGFVPYFLRKVKKEYFIWVMHSVAQ